LTGLHLIMNINRRTFTRTALLGGIAFATKPLWAKVAKDEVSYLCILHTNDTHSRIDPYPENDPRHPGMGGYALRAAAINQVRQEADHVLLLDAGDIFQGTPYYNVYGGEPELRLMSKMGYDASTIGNHEFDNGLDGFLKVLPFANFPFINSNYDFSATILNNKILPYHIIMKGDLKIGIYGLGVELEGLVSKDLYGATRYVDPVFVAQRTELLLKNNHNCDIIICLSHLGFQYESSKVSDKIIAGKTRFTNIILGGHTHNLLDPPVIEGNASGRPVYIGQTGYGGVRLGRMDLYFNQETHQTFVESATTNILKNQVS
jgi:5'-nucleotidase